MAALSLTIRNITINPIELKLVERFESAHSIENASGGIANITNITRTFTGFLSNNAVLSQPELAAKSETFRHQDVTIGISPFETKRTEIVPQAREILRLTFEADGQRYRVDTPTPSHRSTTLKPLTPSPRLEFTAIYLSASSHLTLFSSANVSSWMSKLSDTTPLSALSIPGTHNSPTCHKALPSVRCQAVSVHDQLQNGVRFLDIRVQPANPADPANDDLILVHSAFPISLTGNKYLRDLLNHVFSFLDANPSETVILSLKREGVGKSTDQQLSRILHTHYTQDSSRWFTENRIPSLGEARRKIVLIRRFAVDDSLKKENNGAGWCIDAESWPDNCADGMCTSGEIRVQDFYEVAETVNIDKKITYSTDQLERAAKEVCVLPGGGDVVKVEGLSGPEEQRRHCFYMNFLSASNFWRAGCWPDRIAARVNPVIVDFLCRRHHFSTVSEKEHVGGAENQIGDGSTGIVVCDWVGLNGDWDLVRCIVGMNARLQLKEKDIHI